MKLGILTDMQLLLCVQVDKVNYFIVYSYPITVLWPADRDYEGLPNNGMYELCRLMLNCAK